MRELARSDAGGCFTDTMNNHRLGKIIHLLILVSIGRPIQTTTIFQMTGKSPAG